MDCVSGRLGQKPLDSPSPIFNQKIELLVDRLFEQRWQAIEPGIINRLQNGCFNTLMPELMRRVEHAVHDSLKAMEPEFTWRVQLAVSNKVRADVQKMEIPAQKVETPSQPAAKIVVEPAPEPNANATSVNSTMDILASSSFVHLLESTLEQLTGDKFSKIESEIGDLKSKLSESVTTPTPADTLASSFGIYGVAQRNDQLASNAFPMPASKWREQKSNDVFQGPHTPPPSALLLADEYPRGNDVPQAAIMKLSPRVMAPLPPDVFLEEPATHHEEAYDYPAFSVSNVAGEGDNHHAGIQEGVEPKSSEQWRRSGTSEQQLNFKRDMVRHADAYRVQESV
jgi:hypothetical protein